MVAAILLAGALLAAPPVAWPNPGAQVFSMGAGLGLSSQVAHSLPDRTFAVARASWGYVLHRRAWLEIEGIPLFVLDNGGAATAYGVGFSLLLRTVVAEGERLRFGLDGGGGMLRFDRPVPAGALRTNFTLQLGGFLERAVAARASLVAGFRIHHISNADRAEVNPGINAAHPYLELRLWR